jgi:large subunit ribosomal protein L4
MAKRRQGTHKVKERAEVRGGGKKPYKQKGTGRARQGTTRAPQWRGGGVVFGPRPRSHEFKLNKKVRRSALCSALSKRALDNAITVIDEIALAEAKTKQVVDLLARFELGDTLIVLGSDNKNLALSARNLPNVTVLSAEGVNVYDVLLRSNLVLTRDAVSALTTRLGGE